MDQGRAVSVWLFFFVLILIPISQLEKSEASLKELISLVIIPKFGVVICQVDIALNSLIAAFSFNLLREFQGFDIALKGLVVFMLRDQSLSKFLVISKELFLLIASFQAEF